MPLAHTIVDAVALYLAVGAVFALPFVVVGVGRVDPDARHGTFGFRVLILPGVVLLWPLLLTRWMQRGGPPEERTPHKRALEGDQTR